MGKTSKKTSRKTSKKGRVSKKTRKSSSKKRVSRKKASRRVARKASRTTRKSSKKNNSVRRRKTTAKKVPKKRKTVVKKRKARKPLVRGTRGQVWRGTREKVKTTGHTKRELMKNARGRIVSKKAYKAGLKKYKANGLSKWTNAFMQARKKLGVTGFVACKKGTKLYKEAMRIYSQ